MSTRQKEPNVSRLASRVSLLLVAALFLASSAAFADPFGTGGANTGWLADDRNHTYCHDAGTTGPTREGIVDYAMATLADTTVMTRTRHTSCWSMTDVRWQFGTIEPNVRGRYRCVDRNGSICNQATARVDPRVTGDMVNHRKTACHELGHSVGLSHGAANALQCMTTGAAPNSDWFYRSYRSHHRAHINAQY